jgi:hypothetical protein
MGSAVVIFGASPYLGSRERVPHEPAGRSDLSERRRPRRRVPRQASR